MPSAGWFAWIMSMPWNQIRWWHNGFQLPVIAFKTVCHGTSTIQHSILLCFVAGFISVTLGKGIHEQSLVGFKGILPNEQQQALQRHLWQKGGCPSLCAPGSQPWRSFWHPTSWNRLQELRCKIVSFGKRGKGRWSCFEMGNEWKSSWWRITVSC